MTLRGSLPMSNSFEGDVLLFNTRDGGEIEFVNGQPIMTAGFDAAFFLSLFGGNVEDDGLAGNKKTWWANYNEPVPHKRYISRFQNLARGLPLITGNLRRLEEAAKADLRGFIDEGIAAKVTAVATIPKINFLQLVTGIISPSGESSETRFLINWQSYL